MEWGKGYMGRIQFSTYDPVIIFVFVLDFGAVIVQQRARKCSRVVEPAFGAVVPWQCPRSTRSSRDCVEGVGVSRSTCTQQQQQQQQYVVTVTTQCSPY